VSAIKLVKSILTGLGFLPLVWLGAGIFAGRLGPSPVDTVTAITGQWGMRLIVATLMITPLSIISGWTQLLTFRKILGLFAFLYAWLHFLTFIGLDYFFNIPMIIADVRSTPHIIIGFLTFLLLVPLAITSTRRWKKRLGPKTWQKLHFVVYLAGVSAVLHYFLQVKLVPVDLVVYAVLIVALLGFRLIRFLFLYRASWIRSKAKPEIG
jgi:sulfoxide reductase heme-binding subunit YedZ